LLPLCFRDPFFDPDVVLPDSRALLTNGEMTLGTSNSAAYFAGVVALMKAAEPRLRTRHLLWFAHYGKVQKVAVGRDGTAIPMIRSPGGDRRQLMGNTPTLVRRMPTRASYAFPLPGLPPRPYVVLKLCCFRGGPDRSGDGAPPQAGRPVRTHERVVGRALAWGP
jgi:hypothetical protein